VRYIEFIHKRFSPQTGTDIDELGSMLPNRTARKLVHPIPDWYWNLAGAFWPYVYGHLAQMGIDVVGAAELIDYPGQFAATTLVNWETGQPNARYWVVEGIISVREINCSASQFRRLHLCIRIYHPAGPAQDSACE
jgi:hypothetical protein